MKKILPLIACSLLAFSLIACNGNKDTSVEAPEASTSSVEVSDDMKSDEYKAPEKEETGVLKSTLLSKLIAALQEDENLSTAFTTVFKSVGNAVVNNEDLSTNITELNDFFDSMESLLKTTTSASKSVNFDLDEISILENEGVEAKIYNADVSLNASVDVNQENQTQTIGIKGNVDTSASLKVDFGKAANKVAKDSVLKQVYASATISGNMDVKGTESITTTTTDTDTDTDSESTTVLAGTLNVSADAGITASFLVDNTAGILVVNGNAKINLDESSIKSVQEPEDILQYLDGNLTFTIYDVNETKIDSQTVTLKDFITMMMSSGDTGSNSDTE